MKKLVLMAAVCVAAGQVWAAAFQPKMVSESARWVVHADVELLKQTTVGAFVLKQLEKGDAAAKINALSAILQFDPRKDLTGVTLYGQSKNPEEVVAIVTGAINVQQLVTLLGANPAYEEIQHGATTIYSWIDEKKGVRSYGCALNGKVVISQGLPMIKEAVDVLNGAHPAVDMARSFGEAQVKEPIFMAGSDLPGLGGGAQAQMLSQAKAGRIGLGEKDGQVNLSVALTAVNAETAQKLQQVAQGLIAMGQMNQDKDPELAALLKAAQVTGAGDQVSLSLSYPADKVVALLQAKMDKSAPRTVQKTVPAPAPAP